MASRTFIFTFGTDQYLRNGKTVLDEREPYQIPDEEYGVPLGDRYVQITATNEVEARRDFIATYGGNQWSSTYELEPEGRAYLARYQPTQLSIEDEDV
jgi:hypothetical protein